MSIRTMALALAGAGVLASALDASHRRLGGPGGWRFVQAYRAIGRVRVRRPRPRRPPPGARLPLRQRLRGKAGVPVLDLYVALTPDERHEAAGRWLEQAPPRTHGSPANGADRRRRRAARGRRGRGDRLPLRHRRAGRLPRRRPVLRHLRLRHHPAPAARVAAWPGRSTGCGSGRSGRGGCCRPSSRCWSSCRSGCGSAHCPNCARRPTRKRSRRWPTSRTGTRSSPTSATGVRWPSSTPLTHLWSLAVEEQFYLVWPLLLIVIVRFTRSRRVLAAAAATGAVVSYGAAAVLTAGRRRPRVPRDRHPVRGAPARRPVRAGADPSRAGAERILGPGRCPAGGRASARSRSPGPDDPGHALDGGPRSSRPGCTRAAWSWPACPPRW